MEIYRGIQALTQTLAHPVVSIGNFDGVHRGHQFIIKTALEMAAARGGTALAYTFRPHPQAALRPERGLQLLTTYDERLRLLGASGLGIVIEEPFSREFSTTPPERFFTDSLLHRIGAEAIVVGYDFAFGKERSGHLDSLQKLCTDSGVELVVIPPQRISGEVVSSSRIRQHLLSGEVEAAALLLGRLFSYRGIVQKGDARGRKIGFPTANLRLDAPEGQAGSKIQLPLGVYATWAKFGGTKAPSVTNVGVRPTFVKSEGEPVPVLVETHILGDEATTQLDLYGTELEVEFVKRIREERKFSGIDELKARIAEDVAQARADLSTSAI